MEALVLLIPFVLSGVLVYYLYQGNYIHQDHTLGSIIVIGLAPTFIIGLIVLGMSLGMRHSNFSDTEYLSYYITKIRHTDEWDEWIHRTCTREVPDGTDSKGNTKYRTETYDCSYREYHPERWLKYDNKGDDIYINREEFEELRRRWGTPMRFIDMHRNYYRIDGDAQEYDWDGSWQTCETFTTTHSYENRLLGSQSAFRLREVSKEEAKELGLYDYPTAKNSPIIGIKASPYDTQRFNFINAYYGMNKQIHVFVLVWPWEKGASISEDQRAYWQGGNKNEFVVCIGKDSRDSIRWARCFSWQDDITMDIQCKEFLLSNPRFDLEKLSYWIEGNLSMWNRKPFHDFDYIKSFLTSGQRSTILWTVVILSFIGLFGQAIFLTNERRQRRYPYYRI